MLGSNLKVESNANSGMEEKGDRKILILQICEVLLLTPVMVIIIGLFLIPTVLYVYGLQTEQQVRVINLHAMYITYSCTCIWREHA